jgi:DNA-binding response OmpR family regulator
MNVLLVEDDPALVKTLSQAMTMWGCHVYLARTGQDALKEARRNPINLILLDVTLPDIEGYKLIASFKAIEPKAGIITMTAHSSRDLEAKVRKEGIIYYLIKPFGLKVLKEILDHNSKRNGKFERRESAT